MISEVKRHQVILVAGLILGCVLSVRTITPPRELQAQDSATFSLPSTAPAPSDNPTTPEKVELGKQLFFDSRLSGDNTMSCASCHLPERAFSDGLPGARGSGGRQLSRNTPSLVNAGFFPSYFWDGRAASLEEQAFVPIESAEEMDQDLADLEKELNAIPGYSMQFRSIFGGPATRDTIAEALAAFQRTLVSRNSPFDRFLAGDPTAISDPCFHTSALPCLISALPGTAGARRRHRRSDVASMTMNHKDRQSLEESKYREWFASHPCISNLSLLPGRFLWDADFHG